MFNTTHFIHHNIHYCSGYQQFLINKQQGKTIQFNWGFFLLWPFWLVHHKMYSHFFLINFFYLNFLTLWLSRFGDNIAQAMSSSAIIIVFIHYILTIYSHKLYHLHIDNKFYKLGYDPDKCIKAAKPYPFFITILIIILILLASACLLSIGYIISSYDPTL